MQTTDVLNQYPDVALKMKSHLNTWWESVKDIANEPQRIIIGNEKENEQFMIRRKVV